jgi:hypothetical protein
MQRIGIMKQFGTKIRDVELMDAELLCLKIADKYLLIYGSICTETV